MSKQMSLSCLQLLSHYSNSHLDVIDVGLGESFFGVEVSLKESMKGELQDVVRILKRQDLHNSRAGDSNLPFSLLKCCLTRKDNMRQLHLYHIHQA